MILAIETSTPKASLAVLNPASGGLVFETEFSSDRAHNAAIFEPLGKALDVAGKLSRIIVGTGPGSYGGVRVGIAVANSLAVAHGAEVLGIPSIVSLAESALVVGDARRKSFFAVEVRERSLVETPRVLNEQEFVDWVGKAVDSGEPVLTTDAKPPLDLPGILVATPGASILAAVGANMPVESVPIEPLYIREPYITTPKPRSRPIS